MIVATNHVPGYRITQTLGVVIDLRARALNVGAAIIPEPVTATDCRIIQEVVGLEVTYGKDATSSVAPASPVP